MRHLRNLLMELMVVIGLAAMLYWWWSSRRSEPLTLSETRVEATDLRMERVREIGEWEFLSIAAEEIVDTTFVTPRPWSLSDERRYLARIYRGTLRLGFNLREDAPEGWIRTVGDSAWVSLPEVRLLDERFLDEAQSRPLIEDGKFSAAERKALSERARRQMRQRALTPENLGRCRQEARARMEELLRNLGFQVVINDDR